MNHNNQHPLVKEFVDLEEFGEELFSVTPPAPKLSHKQKKHMLSSILGTSGFDFTRFGFGFAAAVMAAFVLVFGFAQFSAPSSPLYNLKVGGQSKTTAPSLQETASVKAEVTEKQVKIEELKKTGAPQKEITKAQQDLDETVAVGKKKGLEITKSVDASGNIIIDVRQPSVPKNESETEKTETEHNESEKSGSNSSTGSSKSNDGSSVSQPR